MSSNIFIREEVIFGRAVVVTTNAAAGLFGRVKTFFRTRRYKKIARNSYGCGEQAHRVVSGVAKQRAAHG